MSGDTVLSQQVRRFLQGRAQAGERLLAVIRLMVLALAGVRLGFVMDERIIRESTQAVFTYFAWGLATVGALVLTALITRDLARRAVPWLSAAADPAAVIAILLPSVLWPQPGVRALIYEPDGYIFLASTAALGLRLRWGPALLGAAANGLGFFGLLWLDTELNQRGAIEGDTAMAAIVFTATAAVAVASTAWTRRLVAHGAQAALLAQRGKEALGRLVAPEVVAQALAGEALVPRRRLAAVLFSDLRGFTAYAEQADPASLVAELNGYLSAMVRVVERHGGHIDKFIGDAIMAVFGAPVGSDDHADRAIAAALEISRAADGFREWMAARFPDRELPVFDIGIGIHTGAAVVGNIGFERRTEYT
ncbi:MAG: adenylate/guanylate cyclase domain-containing protein, partial [Myxococcales bacterium]|nr:adenylate/guanylate cyclase domain-containing protein [Myxococcales bacterium]